MRLCVTFFCTPTSAGITFLAHARQHLMLFFLFLFRQIHTFHVFPRSCRGPHTGQARSTMKRVGGLEEGDQQPFQFESARLKYKPKPLSHFTFSARQRYFTTDSQPFFVCFIPHKKKKKIRWQTWAADGKDVLQLDESASPSVFDTSHYAASDMSVTTMVGIKTKQYVCSLMQVGICLWLL